jgi:hypothetical protein
MDSRRPAEVFSKYVQEINLRSPRSPAEKGLQPRRYRH